MEMVSGNATHQLRNPWGIYIDSNLVLWIVDRGNHRVLRWPRSEFGQSNIIDLAVRTLQYV